MYVCTVFARMEGPNAHSSSDWVAQDWRACLLIRDRAGRALRCDSNALLCRGNAHADARPLPCRPVRRPRAPAVTRAARVPALRRGVQR